MITSVVQRSKNTIYIYNEKRSVSGIISNAELKGYTSESVSVKPYASPHIVQIYNEKGRYVDSVCC